MRRLLIVFVLLALVAPTAPAAADTTSAQRRLAWLLAISQRLPATEAELREHVAAPMLDAIGGADGFNETVASVAPLTASRTIERTAAAVTAVVDERLIVEVHTDTAGLVDGLWLRPYAPSPVTWSELDSRLRALAPRVSYAASLVDNGCRPVHEVDANRSHPLGSAFKLYVLGALEQRTTDWSANLPIREEWKSLPSGVLQDRPAGTAVTLREHADLMISISDNTATDHLVHHVGRAAVLDRMAATGNRDPRNFPVLTTRELFVLKGFRYPGLAGTYLSLPRVLRPALRPALAAVPRTAIRPWTEPRNLDDIEWFGSAGDMCRALADLDAMASPRVEHAMSIEDGGIGLDRAEYPEVWFKGGSEPGLLVLNHLARTAEGRTVVATVMLSDQDGALAPGTAVEALALVRGGIELATS
ncbi:serine hydrolase [Actinophytocola glycyrrhizae]|uniref:Serine hydrolase n=1 Tax=Actinophytocola glycyrrhizae TaxID=2044873 RepID=A0ABV9RYD6_9PSEU